MWVIIIEAFPNESSGNISRLGSRYVFKFLYTKNQLEDSFTNSMASSEILATLEWPILEEIKGP